MAAPLRTGPVEGLSFREFSRYASSILLQINVERVVIGLVKKVGLARSDMTERSQDPGESLAQIGEIWDGALRLMQFAIEFAHPLTLARTSGGLLRASCLICTIPR